MNGPSLWVPTVLILVGLLWNNTRIDRLADKIDKLDGKFTDKIDKLDSKFTDKIDKLDSKFTGEIARLDQKIDSKTDALRDANHRDAVSILSAMTALHERVAVVESNQGR